MNKSIDNILSQVYELEGLLLLVENHGKNTNSYVLGLIRQKAQKIAELSQYVEVESENAQPVAPIATPVVESQPCEEVKPECRFTPHDEQEFEMLGMDTCCDVEEEFNPEEVTEIEQTAEHDDDEVNDSQLAGEQDDFLEDNDVPMWDIENENQEESHVEEIENMTTKIEEAGTQLADEQDDFLEDNDVPMWDIENEDQEENENYIYEDHDEKHPVYSPEEEELEEKEEEYVDDDYSPEEDIEEDEVLTVEEALSRSLSKNLKQAFTLNDRFRYRRELFGNSDVEMTNTLNLVEAMDSYAEAEEYFYGDLEWDKDSPEVVDFMSIINNHFA